MVPPRTGRGEVPKQVKVVVRSKRSSKASTLPPKPQSQPPPTPPDARPPAPLPAGTAAPAPRRSAEGSDDDYEDLDMEETARRVVAAASVRNRAPAQLPEYLAPTPTDITYQPPAGAPPPVPGRRSIPSTPVVAEAAAAIGASSPLKGEADSDVAASPPVMSAQPPDSAVTTVALVAESSKPTGDDDTAVEATTAAGEEQDGGAEPPSPSAPVVPPVRRVEGIAVGLC